MLRDDYDTPARQKRRVPHLALEREAVTALRPFVQMLGPWQSDAVRLDTMAQRLRQSGRHDPGVSEAVQTLLTTVEHQRQAFEAVAATLSCGAAESSRIGDARKGLEMVACRLRRTLKQLEGG